MRNLSYGNKFDLYENINIVPRAFPLVEVGKALGTRL